MVAMSASWDRWLPFLVLFALPTASVSGALEMPRFSIWTSHRGLRVSLRKVWIYRLPLPTP